METIRLPYRPPYDWDSMLAFLRARAIAGVEIVEGDRYARTIEAGGSGGTVSVEPATRSTLRATIRFPRSAAVPAIVARVKHVFDLAADPRLIEAHLAADPVLAPLVAARPGLRVPGGWDGFELAVRAMLGQQITVVAAVGLARKLVIAYGTPLAGAKHRIEGLTHLFPRPRRLAGADLWRLGMPRARAAALSSMAAAVDADRRMFHRAGSLDDLVARLRALPGVGDWTAQYVAMRAFRAADAFPAADVALLRAMERAAGRRPNVRELLQRAEAWRPWRAYAAQHLWTSLHPHTPASVTGTPAKRA